MGTIGKVLLGALLGAYVTHRYVCPLPRISVLRGPPPI